MSKEQARKDKIAAFMRKLEQVPVAGKEVSIHGSKECILCRRKIEHIGKILFPGMLSCQAARCETCKASDVNSLFETRFGRAIDTWTLRTFLRCIDGTHVVVDRSEMLERAEDLATSFVLLQEWQWAFESWMHIFQEKSKEQGRTVVLPPRRIDEIVRIRMRGPWTWLDPSARVEGRQGDQIRQIFESGPSLEEVPF